MPAGVATSHTKGRLTLLNRLDIAGQCSSVERHTVLLALVPVLLTAGCMGILGGETEPSDSTTASADRIPGVTNGTLSNASALVEANRNAVTTDGAILHVNESSAEMDIDARLAVGAGFSTYSLSASGTIGDGQYTTIDQWSNETTQFVRTSADEETNYRVLDGPEKRLTSLSEIYGFLSTGEFEVTNQTTDDGLIVLTADNASNADTSTPAPERFDGRLVVDESGQIHSLSVTLTRGGEQVSYNYTLAQAGVERVPKPAWTANVPPGATVQAQLSVDVKNGSYLALTHTGGDVVPGATTVRVESNGTTDTVSLDSSLTAGDTRYLYVDASSAELQVSTDRPEQGLISPVTSPVSVRVATDGDAVLHSSSIGWESESASVSATDSSGGSTRSGDTTA